MSKNKKHPSVTEDDRSEMEYICPSASMSDMTGLIPVSVDDKDGEREAYDDVLPYIPRSQRITSENEF